MPVESRPFKADLVESVLLPVRFGVSLCPSRDTLFVDLDGLKGVCKP
jgi:hypothetical protein